MARAKTAPIVELREALNYDPVTGVFTWRVSRGKAKVGKVAGSPSAVNSSKTYMVVRFHGVNYYAHILAWAFSYGAWPELQIDHRDGDTLHNALANLRDVSVAMNQHNRSEPNSNSTTGAIGVSRTKRKGAKPYRASIKVNMVKKYLGYFATIEEASAAYWEAKRELHIGYITPKPTNAQEGTL